MLFQRSAGLIAPLLALAFLPLKPAFAQARGAQTQTPAQAPATQAPATQTPGGRGGRGGAAGPGPALGGEVDETPVVTHHSITVDGKQLNYTATVAQMPLKDASGE